DGERVVRALSLDPRVLSDFGSPDDPEGTEPPNHLLAVASSGYAVRASLAAFAEPSTRVGRKFVRLRENETVAGVHGARQKAVLMLATSSGRVLLCEARQVNFLSGPGRGVVAIKLAPQDKVIGTAISRAPSSVLRAYTTGGRKVDITTRRYNVTNRGGKGVEVIKRGGLERVELEEIEVPELPEPRASGQNGTKRSTGENGTQRSNGK